MRQTLLFSLSMLTVHTLNAQTDSVSAGRYQAQYRLEIGGLAASASRTPFWLRANQYGIVPTTSPAGLVRLGTSGRLGKSAFPQKVQLTYGLEAVGSVSTASKVLLPEAYVSAQLGKFYVYGGRRREIIGLGDSTLSSGFYSWSGNAIPIPKVQIGTNGFAPLRLTGNILAINTFFAHGWFGNTDSIQHSYIHQKALYARIGKPSWKIKLYGGIIHSAQWGGQSDYLGSVWAENGKLPSSFNNYIHVVTVKRPQKIDNITQFDAINRVGNHVGSIDIGVEMDLKYWNIFGYYQHPYEDKSGVAMRNLPDGLYGLRFKRSPTSIRPVFMINQLTVECLTTMNQSGGNLLTSMTQYQGLDDYFNNFQYLDGWSHLRQVIGTPFMTRRQDVRRELQKVPGGYPLSIVNNRVQLLHFGISGLVGSTVQFKTLLSYSHNYGIYRAPFRRSVNQLSGALWLTWPLNWLGGSELQTAIAIDQGQLLYDSVGGWISLRKTWRTSYGNKR